MSGIFRMRARVFCFFSPLNCAIGKAERHIVSGRVNHGALRLYPRGSLEDFKACLRFRAGIDRLPPKLRTTPEAPTNGKHLNLNDLFFFFPPLKMSTFGDALTFFSSPKRRKVIPLCFTWSSSSCSDNKLLPFSVAFRCLLNRFVTA